MAQKDKEQPPIGNRSADHDGLATGTAVESVAAKHLPTSIHNDIAGQEALATDAETSDPSVESVAATHLPTPIHNNTVGQEALAANAEASDPPVELLSPPHLLVKQFGFKSQATTAKAATCLVVTQGDAPQMLFIERAVVEGDPWSGNIAFPGGRVEPTDKSLADAAKREALEEIGLQLPDPVGRLHDTFSPIGKGLECATFVFSVSQSVVQTAFTLQESEVAQAFWWPVERLLDPQLQTRAPVRPEENPGVFIGENNRILWGMTYGWMYQFLTELGFGRDVLVPNNWS